jgi:hypothetical protein
MFLESFRSSRAESVAEKFYEMDFPGSREMVMNIGFIGWGRMGGGMGTNLLKAGHHGAREFCSCVQTKNEEGV